MKGFFWLVTCHSSLVTVLFVPQRHGAGPGLPTEALMVVFLKSAAGAVERLPQE